MYEGIDRIVIAGAGQAGATVAFGLRRAGYNREIVVVGEEAHLPYERPQLSKEMLKPEKNGNHCSIKSRNDYADHEIGLELGHRIAQVDGGERRVFLEDGREIGYDRLVIATGVNPRKLPMALGDADHMHYLRTVEDARKLRADLETGKPIAIVGGGVIGLEVAAAARALGCNVIVVEAADRLMSRSVDDIVSSYLDRAHRNNQIDIRYGVHATELSNGILKLSNGDTVPACSVLVGIGVTPNVAGFEHLGITDVAGVRVDAHGQSGIEGIFATGDIASQPQGARFGRVETWANAQDHALNVVKNLLGERSRYESPTWFWSDQGPLNLQVVGDGTHGKRVIRGDERGDSFSVFWLDDNDQVTGCSSINSPKDMAMARRWVKQGNRVDPQRIEDTTVPLRDCAI